MSVADVDTWGLLDRWAVIMLENQWHFNQVAGVGAPLTEPCDQVYVNSERAYIANALNNAAEMAADFLGFYPRPTYTSKTVTFGGNYRYQFQPVRLLNGGYIEAIGARAITLIEAAAPVVYSDWDGDGVADLATITIASTTVDADEIQLFFRVADGADAAGDTLWRIEPAKVVKAGNVATITAHKSLFVKPTLWRQAFTAPNYTIKNDLNIAIAANFVTTVDVYRVYPDTTSAVTFRSDGYLSNCDGCAADNTTTSACARIEDSLNGRVQLRLSDTWCYDYAVQSVAVSYFSGYPLDANGLMNRRLEQSIIRLANTLMPQKPCNFCDRTLNMWDWDHTEDPRANENLNPFGSLYGQTQAYRVMSDMALGYGGKITIGTHSW